MNEPDLVTARLEDEDAIATVNLGGDDQLIITPTRSLLYEAEGLISDESVTEYPHEIQRIAVSRGRRKATIELTYPLEGTKSLRVPKSSLDSVIHYLLAGVLNARSITNPGEVVRAVYLFNELTVIVTSERVVTNVGTSVWDDEYDEYRYADLTGMEFEEGDVATQIVLYVNGRSQRIKAPKSQAEKVRHELQSAVFEYFDVSTRAELVELFDDPVSEEGEEVGDSSYPFDDAVDPLGAISDDDESAAVVEMDEAADPQRLDEEVIGEATVREIEQALTEMQTAIDRQQELLDAQQRAIDDLVETISDT